jgi:hypothetical protein
VCVCVCVCVCARACVRARVCVRAFSTWGVLGEGMGMRGAPDEANEGLSLAGRE